MHKGKKAILALAAVALLTSQAHTIPTAGAAYDAPTVGTMENSIRPMLVDTEHALVRISYSGGMLTASLSVTTKDDSIASKGTLYMEKYSGGKWIAVRTWTINKTGDFRLAPSVKGTRGNTYRVRADFYTGADHICSVSEELTI